MKEIEKETRTTQNGIIICSSRVCISLSSYNFIMTWILLLIYIILSEQCLTTESIKNHIQSQSYVLDD